MIVIYVITVVAFVASVYKSPKKTRQALEIAWRKFLKVAPAFVQIVCAVSLILYFVPNELIATSLGAENRWYAVCLAAGLGSITILPGFIAFPLAAVLLQKGAAYMVLSAFTTCIMMVGLVTIPLEKAYFGLKVTLMRNAIGLLIALAVALATGLVFGELV
jgi:uncharacterized membrane protein YraQ (UPF0718 family)